MYYLTKTWRMIESAENYGLAYGVLVKTGFAANEGIDLWTRKSKYNRWYHHGLFGTDATVDVARCEIAESFRLKYGR